ncbi:non-ribosomal peptide synthetase [Paenibacillus sp. IHBB 10380]|uniref:non-ribosomal peptide synthetase n=1 Tax=Paenibacillus sp. IHBB 10380 TaxID=1566358 RepID=UPI00069813EF|nr:non-ribosomal peptide synthetase [Paenibacillus sp. IHBB 10380]
MPVTTKEFIKTSPLSEGQKSIYLHHHLHPKSSMYIERFAWKIYSEIDASYIKQAFKELTKRHEIFRTIYAWEQEPVQKVHNEPIVDFGFLDAYGWDVSSVNQYLTEESHKPYDLEQEPILRSRLIRCADEEYILLLMCHHIAFDGWTFSLILDEIGIFYKHLKNGSTFDLISLKYAYSDFVDWQQEFLTSEEGYKSKLFWKEKLSGDLPILNFPIDHNRLAIPSQNGKLYPFELSSELSRKLNVFCKEEEASLYTVMLSLYFAFLHRYSGQDEIIVGTPRFGRKNKYVKVCGYFVNMLPIRIGFTDDISFVHLLSIIRAEYDTCVSHQHYPFSLMAEHVMESRDPSYSPVFQTAFVLQKAWRQDAAIHLGNAGNIFDLHGIKLEPYVIEKNNAKFDLTLIVEEENNGNICFNLEYNSDIFELHTISRLTRYFQEFIQSVLHNPRESISKVSLLPEAEHKQLVDEWNDTTIEYPSDAVIHKLFEDQVSRKPEAIAVVHEGRHLTYRELNERANQLAHYLQKRGVGPESIVGICMERSIEMIIGMMGILKADAAYLPLDPAYPEALLRYIVQDAGIQLLITQEALKDWLPEGITTVFLDLEQEEIAQESTSTPNCRATPQNLAYVIYTSGSTGNAKGVLLEHKGLCNLVHAQIDLFLLNSTHSVIQFASLAFDAAVSEIFTTFLAGATLCIPTQDDVIPGPQLLRFLQDNRVTHATFPPAVLIVLDEPVLNDLKVVISAGSACTKEIAQRWSNGRRFINGYGPTETTVAATMSVYEGNQSPTIGQPLANVQVFVLDRNQQLVPIGVIGELYIGGAGLARGYLNRPDLTQERFILHPFNSYAGARLYRTGDLVRYLPNGTLDFVGQMDNQVYVRGFRIELGEVESALQGNPAITQAAVLVREDVPGDKRLVAYVVGEGSIKGWREYLKAQLPNYMLPSYFVQMEVMPLTTNGKIDYKNLPAPERQGKEDAYVAPRNQREQILSSVWEKVLGVKRIGIHDNFFESGGDSILSIQIVSQANQTGLKLTPKQLFEYPTIAELAHFVGEVAFIEAEQGAVTGEVAFTPVQHWFFEQSHPYAHHWNQSMLLHLCEKLDIELLREALQAILFHHDALRMRYDCSTNGVWTQRNEGLGEQASLTVVNLGDLPQKEWDQTIQNVIESTQASLNLHEGPLMRVVYFNEGIHGYGQLFWAIHHLAVDGVSWRILQEDLQTIYRQAQAGQFIRLPDKTTSFKTWSEKLQTYGESGCDQKVRDYWKQHAQMEVNTLPTDYLAEDTTESSTERITVTLCEEETQALLQDVPAAYRTRIQEVLMTALAQTIHQWTGETSMSVQLEGHGREEIMDGVDLSRTVGWFTSIYPVQISIKGANTSADALKAVKEQMRKIPNHGVDYGILRYLNQEIGSLLKTQQKSSISFNYLGQFGQASSTDSIFTNELELTANFDPNSKRTQMIDVVAIVINGKLQINWMYSHKQMKNSTIEHLASVFVERLHELIAHCTGEGSFGYTSSGYTPSDFPLAELNQRQLDCIIQNTPDIEMIYPLAPLQHGMLFHSWYEADGGDYISQCVITFEGDLRTDLFKLAWQLIVDRHDVLRTSFDWKEGSITHQIVHRSVSVAMEEQDWRGFSRDEQDTRIVALLRSERVKGFDLEQLPLSRMFLIHTGDHAYRFVWSHHHALLDGWSLQHVLNEVLVVYDALATNKKIELESVPAYQNYIRWIKSQDMVQAEKFWREELKGFTAPTPLGIDITDCDNQSGYGESLHPLSVALTRTYNRGHGTTRLH